jgi:hypothetical protein
MTRSRAKKTDPPAVSKEPPGKKRVNPSSKADPAIDSISTEVTNEAKEPAVVVATKKRTLSKASTIKVPAVSIVPTPLQPSVPLNVTN